MIETNEPDHEMLRGFQDGAAAGRAIGEVALRQMTGR
jgi:hypothetical protein